MIITLYILFLFLPISWSASSPKGNAVFCYHAMVSFDDFDLFFNRTTCQDSSYEYYCTLDGDTQNWFYALYREAMSEMFNTAPPRKRQEIRTLKETQRRKFFSAINALKNDKDIKPNKYEALALIHTSLTLCSALKGTNFLGWNRIYLLIFETALRQKDNSVVLPYWDSIIDSNNVIEPYLSVIFTDTFFGNGNGFVLSGPFANWSFSANCSLIREIGYGNRSLLCSKIIDAIQNDINIQNLKQITYQGHHDPKYTIEGQQTNLHDWIGGTMAILDKASEDPIFYTHHAFVDYIWEQFRKKQERMGVDPETDYPILGLDIKRHLPNRTMDCFFWLKNIDGLSNNFSDIVSYEMSPSCPSCGNSKYLECNFTLGTCVSSKEFHPTENEDVNNFILFCIILGIVFFLFLLEFLREICVKVCSCDKLDIGCNIFFVCFRCCKHKCCKSREGYSNI